MTSNRSAEAALDATDALLGEKPWAKISLGAVATRAGVSRQTLYNEFGDRAGLAQAFVLREADRLLRGPEEALTRHAGDPATAVAVALETFLAAAQDNHLLRAMRREQDGDLLALITTRGEVLEVAIGRLHAHALRVWPGADPAAARALMDVVVRLGISHANFPTGSPHASAAAVAGVLGPHVEALVPSLRSQAA